MYRASHSINVYNSTTCTPTYHKPPTRFGLYISGHLQAASVVHRVICLCKIGVWSVVLCLMSVLTLLKLLKLLCIVSIACTTVVFPHLLSQLNLLCRIPGRNPWRYFVVITSKMLGGLALLRPTIRVFHLLWKDGNV